MSDLLNGRVPWVLGVSGASGTPYARSVLRGLINDRPHHNMALGMDETILFSKLQARYFLTSLPALIPPCVPYATVSTVPEQLMHAVISATTLVWWKTSKKFASTSRSISPAR